MLALRLLPDAGEDKFRAAVRHALARNVAPHELAFVGPGVDLLFDDISGSETVSDLTVPRAFVELMRDALCHRAEDRFALLYGVLWRLKHGEPDLLDRAADPAIAKLSLYAKAVHRDTHKMHAFVRFHKKRTDDGDIFVAWFEPEHYILKRATPFFAGRFANMRWIVATPIGSASWNLEDLKFAPPGPKPAKLEDPVLDGLWATYYRTIFNPARLKTDAMLKEMPRRYWKNLPETSLVDALVKGAQTRVAAMDKDADVAPRFAGKATPHPRLAMTAKDTLSQIRAAAEVCTDCALFKSATQTVFGEGPARARLVLVGEQPGDAEDLAGRPFVGPAGQVLHRAMVDAGIDRNDIYITNAVKHFKFEPRGKRRIHSKPSLAEIKVCRQWVTRELMAVDPSMVVALGATAAQSLMGKSMVIGKTRGREIRWADGRRGIVTIHPSYLLRQPDEAAKAREYQLFVRDLKLAAEICTAG